MGIGLEKDGLSNGKNCPGLGIVLDWNTSLGLRRQTWTRQIVLDLIEKSLGLDTETVERAGLEKVGANLLSPEKKLEDWGYLGWL